MMFKKRFNLVGGSGCRLVLCQDIQSGGLFVRKTSSLKAYNVRLIRQCDKQGTFSLPPLRSPQILRSGYDSNGLFWFDMEYVKGKTLAAALTTCSAIEIQDYVKQLFMCLATSESKIVDSEKIFKNKIFALAQNSKCMGEEVVSALSKLLSLNFQSLPTSRCVGDLTLENILVQEDTHELYLIDFLDSFFDSWLIDMAKLLQDLECGWSWRFEPHDATRELRCALAKDLLQKQILSLPDGKKRLLQVYQMLLLNLVRIFPYTTDTPTIVFLKDRLNKVISIINQWEADE